MSGKYTFKVINFGCPVSQYEGRAIEAAMEREGFVKTSGRAGIYIINSCVVTASAAAEARRVLRKSKRENPGAIAVIAGCYPQVYHKELQEKLPEADIIIGTSGRSRLPYIIEKKLAGAEEDGKFYVKPHDGSEKFEYMPVKTWQSRTRPVIKVQEGCDRQCAYCIVAPARGRPRSLPPEKVLEQVELFVNSGCREIILAGNHLGIYGKDLQDCSLEKLLQRLDNLPGKFRIRLDYLEPMDVREELLETMAGSEKICPHLYLPLQSGSDRILKRMRRNYSTEDYRRLVVRARELMPDVSVFTDIIAGFPGETEDDHRCTVELLRELELSRLHVFSFSPRPGTPAYRYKGEVPPEVKKRRVRELRELNDELMEKCYVSMKGKIMQVVPERIVNVDGEDWAEGLSANNTRVRFSFTGEVCPGEIYDVKLLNADKNVATGCISYKNKL